MDTVGGNVRGKRAVCVVEQIVALKIEDRLAVGEGLGIIIEVIKICVIHCGTARILRCRNVKVRHDVDYRIRLSRTDLIDKIAVGLLERFDRAADIVYAEHDIYLAELPALQKRRKSSRSDSGNICTCAHCTGQAETYGREERCSVDRLHHLNAHHARVTDKQCVVKIALGRGRELQGSGRRLRCRLKALGGRGARSGVIGSSAVSFVLEADTYKSDQNNDQHKSNERNNLLLFCHIKISFLDVWTTHRSACRP